MACLLQQHDNYLLGSCSFAECCRSSDRTSVTGVARVYHVQLDSMRTPLAGLASADTYVSAQPTGPGATLYLALFGITLGFVSTFWAFSYVRHWTTAEVLTLLL